jgi:hypothetical protein
LTIIDLHGGFVLKENILRFADFRRVDGYAPGILMIPYVVFCEICFIAGIYYLNLARKKYRNKKYIFPVLGLVMLVIGAAFTGLAFYIKIDYAQALFNFILIFGISPYVYFILSYYQLVNNERNIFDKSFIYRTLVLFLIIAVYLVAFLVDRGGLHFLDVVFVIVLILLIMVSHSTYEWIITFVNDLLYYPSSGLSLVNDQEISDVLKNLNSPGQLESSPLLRLNYLKGAKSERRRYFVDELRKLVIEAVEYFAPDSDQTRRTKKNLKYHLLKMIAYDQAEEGQILWELGFDEYPVRILTKETKDRPPLFKAKSPSDYTYTSRNAYLALKREAIHDVAWRISYLEKLSKKKISL